MFVLLGNSLGCLTAPPASHWWYGLWRHQAKPTSVAATRPYFHPFGVALQEQGDGPLV
jgi:hypothetical protein